MYNEEIWLQHPDPYFNELLISDYGRVYNIKKSYMYKLQKDRGGYFRVHYKEKYFSVHRLVAQTFIPNPEEYPVVRHIDNDNSNNHVDNLCWGTQKDNVNDCINAGNFHYIGYTQCTPVKAINLTDNTILYFNSQREAARKLNLDNSSITKVLKNKYSQTGNYRFEYV